MLKRKKLTNLEEGKKEIICQIEELRKKRDNLSLYITKLNESYNSGMINKEVYDKKLLENLKDKDHEYWEYHYESQINNYKLKFLSNPSSIFSSINTLADSIISS